ncbi:hypothetical protein LXM25_22370 [Dyadobacter sp. LJ53]|uniref:hypothetical protein n=1 Tax=Dyadobacter chenwenxiniae TaxID=2906456 RepID=UPI001F1FD099|nr:hypothetical protein [Dyadobacter chenwenxiniae]MCF0052833.1 hypothetical protein [Dyadobacter chenwenxiniae]
MNTPNELFSTAKGFSLQCDLTAKIILHFGEMQASFRIQDFLNFRRFINNIDIHSKIFDLSDDSDYEFVEAPQLNINHKLTLCEVIQLRELVNGTHFAIELNSLLHELLFNESELV